MIRTATSMIALLRVLFRPRNLSKLVGTCVPLLMALAAMSFCAAAQSSLTESGISDLLGPHADGARGCAVCHASRSGQPALQQDRNTSASTFLWGSDRPPEYLSAVAATAQKNAEVAGVLLCLSCHDGNLTPHNMLQPWSYEHEIGLLDQTPFRNQKIPSLLGRDEEGSYDHPIGTSAPINPGGGLVFSNGTFSVMPNSPYAHFIANYGWPSLAPGKRSSAYGVNSPGEPFTLCTTCHDQHVRNAFVSGANSPIEGDASGKVYTTYLFVNGPYDPAPDKLANHPTTSSAQFCRQCHFDLSNEGNNILTARTLF